MCKNPLLTVKRNGKILSLAEVKNASETTYTTEESKNKDTPVIMLTANVFPGAYEQYAKEGFVDYISKPIDCIKLEKTISSYLPKDKVKFL